MFCGTHIILASEVKPRLQLTSIGTIGHASRLRQRLDVEFHSLKHEGINIDITERQKGSMRFVDLRFGEACSRLPAMPDDRVRANIAQAVSDVIVDDMEETIVARILKHGYSYRLAREEYVGLLDYVKRELNADHDTACMSLNKSARKEHVVEAVVDYLKINQEIVLEGFVRFRLKEYMRELEDAIDRAVDEYLLEREYGEFIRLLRYFVETQQPRRDEVHVMITHSGEFWLADKNGKPIRDEQMDDLVIEMIEGDIEYEDVLMSSLITIAPRQVVVHQPDKAETALRHLETIKNVFGTRVRICKGCEICAPGSAHETPL